MPSTDLVIVADGSYNGSNGTGGVGFQIHGVGFHLEGGAAFSKHLCRSSIDAEIAAILRGMIVAYRLMAKHPDLAASSLLVRCDCQHAVDIMAGKRPKGIAPWLIVLRARVLGWYGDDGYAVKFKRIAKPEDRPRGQLAPLHQALKACDQLSKSFCGFGYSTGFGLELSSIEEVGQITGLQRGGSWDLKNIRGLCE